jgi:hypothetical protein
MRAQSRFSEYLPEAASGLRVRLAAAAEAAGGGLAGIAAGLNEFESMSADQDPLALRYALQLFVTHSRDAAGLGLQVPSLEERSPWTILPNRTESNQG